MVNGDTPHSMTAGCIQLNRTSLPRCIYKWRALQNIETNCTVIVVLVYHPFGLSLRSVALNLVPTGQNAQ